MEQEGVSLGALFAILFVLLLCSAFFSGTETALMSVNRYRLRHRSRSGHRGSRLAERLLASPDRLIGLILLGNNLVNFSASSLTTMIAMRFGGNEAIAISVGIFTLVVLIFAEVAPKTLAALYPERLALPAAYLYTPLLRATYPLVWVVNMMANGVLKLFGVDTEGSALQSFSREELRTVLAEAGGMIPRRHQQMLLSILDLEKVTVDDIMVPRNEIVGLDLADDWDEIAMLIDTAHHTRMPIFEDSMDNIVGMLHMRRLVRAMSRGDLDRDTLRKLAVDPYFVPEGTPLHKQMLNFQSNRERIGLVVDEYGDILGLVTLEDILEEIVGEFTTDPATLHDYVQRDGEAGFVVDCSANVRSLNRSMRWKLPTDGAKTLNGLILEQLGTIPQSGTRLNLSGYDVKIIQTSGNAVRTVRIRAPAATAR